ncbi:MAG: metal ABC transporter solute-binding protein, Zn/Mn family [bacterium]
MVLNRASSGVRSLAATALVALAFGTAQALAGPTAAGRVPVVATFYPLFEFTARVGGDRVTVRTLVPAGVESHDYEPTPRDVVALIQARVIVYNGAGFEPWLRRLLPQLPGRVVTINATEGLPIHRGTSVGRAGPPDPHVWLDPVLAQRQVDRILAGLVSADPAGRGTYESNAAAYKGGLGALHGRIAQTLAPCRKKVIVVSHAAFGYFTARYGLTQIAISGLEPGEEPSPARMRDLLHAIRRHRVTVIYYETLMSPRVAAAIAREVGARTLVLNPLEGLTDEEQRAGKDYMSIMEENLRSLVAGLDCP